ncbi:MAG: oxidoreductase, partial [Paenibacillus sp. RIFOXYA1_FULL_44_5]
WVSEMGLGCMSLGTEEQTAIRLIDEALDLGINFLDTADLYDRGRNEEIVGKALKQKRSEVILATKVGNRWTEGQDSWHWDASKLYIKEAVKLSLKRLQTDYIDLYQLHGGTMDDPIEETIEAFEELKQEGWIRHYGISSIRHNVIREYVKRSSIASVMMQYSIVDRRPEEEMLSLLSEHQISVIARGPVARGVLSAKWREKATEGYLDYSSDELIRLAEQLSSMEEGRELLELALRYVLAEAAVAAAIPGASTIEQLQQNVRAVRGEALNQQAIEQIRSLSRANRYTAHRD